jgi:hypothetical protein
VQKLCCYPNDGEGQDRAEMAGEPDTCRDGLRGRERKKETVALVAAKGKDVCIPGY